jgi:ribosomal protein S12 methylthiotransferase
MTILSKEIMQTKNKADKINIVTLGCSKNVVDSEFLAGQLQANKLKIVNDSNDSDAKTVVINTCGFIKDAKEESVDTILQFAEAKKQGEIDHVFVMGCLSERYKHVLKDEIKEVDGFFGSNDLPKIVEAVGATFKHNLIGERKQFTPNHYAYLKVSEGCNRKCSFCAIPLMRGKHVSKSMQELVTETQKLVDSGVKETMLIAQDLSFYGFDIYKQGKLAELVAKLSDINGLEWIRLHYLYPSQFPIDVLDVMRDKENVCNYIDMPFQHISDAVLTKMRRGVNKEHTLELINKIRSQIPDVALRTTMLVGHPGEGEKEFQELAEFVKAAKFERLGVFTYSEEEDTFGAQNFEDSIPHEVKQERADALMQVQEGISNELNNNKINKSFKVIIDRKEGEEFIGRTEYDSPEVDNEVIIQNTSDLKIGEFYNVKITAADSYDLFGHIN